jgi:hypothetical protein
MLIADGVNRAIVGHSPLMQLFRRRNPSNAANAHH